MYLLSDFENNVNYKNIQAEKILEKFFTWVATAWKIV